jgi:hypothetical protein
MTAIAVNRALKGRFVCIAAELVLARVIRVPYPDTRKSDRGMTALLQMTKFDIAALQRASDGKTPTGKPA